MLPRNDRCSSHLSSVSLWYGTVPPIEPPTPRQNLQWHRKAAKHPPPTLPIILLRSPSPLHKHLHPPNLAPDPSKVGGAFEPIRICSKPVLNHPKKTASPETAWLSRSLEPIRAQKA